jgi:3-oxoacyl-[acyl-carrier protein] reductase
MNIGLSKRIALITGGAGQLGRVICRTLVECGAEVVICYHSQQARAFDMQAELSKPDQRVLALQADVTDPSSLLTLREQINERLGALPDIIVNNAVIQYSPWNTVLEQDLADYESQYRSCVLHNVLMAKTFVPAMLKKGWGRVIAINTECAMQNFAGQSAYVSGKRGMDGVLRALAREVGPAQVTVNQVAPGWMISDDSPADDSQLEYTAKVPLRRRGTDRDVANLVAFLASDLAGFISGQYISVSGGNVMPAI